MDNNIPNLSAEDRKDILASFKDVDANLDVTRWGQGGDLIFGAKKRFYHDF